MRCYAGRFLVLGVALVCNAQVVRSDLVGHWTFDSETNVGAASAGSDLNVYGSAAYTAAGKLGGAAKFEGTGDYLAMAGDVLPEGLPVGDSSFTIMLWMKFDVSADPQNVGYGLVGWGGYGTANRVNAFRTGNKEEIGSTYRNNGEGTTPTDFDYGIGHYSWGGWPDIFRGADGQAARPDIGDGDWHLLAATYDAKNTFDDGVKSLYADAILLGTEKIVNELDVSGIHFRIGCTNWDEWFFGLLDDVAVWNRPLASGEVKAVYDLAAGGLYHYHAGEADLLLAAHAAQSMGPVYIHDSEWIYQEGLTGAAGLSPDGQILVIDATAGTGMIIIPEPSMLSLAFLVTVVLLARHRHVQQTRFPLPSQRLARPSGFDCVPRVPAQG